MMLNSPRYFPIAFQEHSAFFRNLLKKWSGRGDLNPRPHDPQRYFLNYNTFKPSIYKYLVFPIASIHAFSGLKVTVILPSQGVA